ncbi:MAG TPA: class I SAM-dependent methyltransferase, partial [Chloroflexota bacterium]
MLWLDPVPTEQDIGKAYHAYYTHPDSGRQQPRPVLWLLSRLADAYLRRRLGYVRAVGPAWNVLLGPLASAVFKLLPGGCDTVEAIACHLPAPRPGARLLEVGFGSGDRLARMVALGWNAEGVDFDPVSVDAARARGLQVSCGDLASRAFPDEHFDAVYLSHLIEHVHDPAALLAECYRVLRPAGAIVIATPNTASWLHDVFGADWMALDPPRHLVLFSAASLRKTVEQAGFVVCELRTSARISAIVWGASVEIRRFGRVV